MKHYYLFMVAVVVGLMTTTMFTSCSNDSNIEANDDSNEELVTKKIAIQVNGSKVTTQDLSTEAHKVSRVGVTIPDGGKGIIKYKFEVGDIMQIGTVEASQNQKPTHVSYLECKSVDSNDSTKATFEGDLTYRVGSEYNVLWCLVGAGKDKMWSTSRSDNYIDFTPALASDNLNSNYIYKNFTGSELRFFNNGRGNFYELGTCSVDPTRMDPEFSVNLQAVTSFATIGVHNVPAGKAVKVSISDDGYNPASQEGGFLETATLSANNVYTIWSLAAHVGDGRTNPYPRRAQYWGGDNNDGTFTFTAGQIADIKKNKGGLISFPLYPWTYSNFTIRVAIDESTWKVSTGRWTIHMEGGITPPNDYDPDKDGVDTQKNNMNRNFWLGEWASKPKK